MSEGYRSVGRSKERVCERKTSGVWDRKRRWSAAGPAFLIVPMSENLGEAKMTLEIIDTVSMEYMINDDTCLNSGHAAHCHRASSILYTTTNQKIKLTSNELKIKGMVHCSTHV